MTILDIEQSRGAFVMLLWLRLGRGLGHSGRHRSARFGTPAALLASKPTFLMLKSASTRALFLVTVKRVQVRVPLAAPKKHYTRPSNGYALELSAQMTIKDVANHLAVGWLGCHQVTSSTAGLQRCFGKPKLHKLKQIAIDEISNIGKGHRYPDHRARFAQRGRGVRRRTRGQGVDALQPFWKLLMLLLTPRSELPAGHGHVLSLYPCRA